MQASELIQELETLIKQYGDRPITTCEVGASYYKATYSVQAWDYGNAFFIAGRSAVSEDKETKG